jgi:predicted amidohydrolase YtcJ
MTGGHGEDGPGEGAPDRVLVSENVITMAADTGPADGLLIRGGRIERLIRRDEVPGLASDGAVVDDVGSRPILPGFIDVHAHAEVAAWAAYGTVDCRAPECGGVEDVLAVLSDAVGAGTSEWVVGQGNLFLDRKLREGRLPTRDELDRVSRTVPIALRAGGHLSVLNSRALEAAGIDREYQPPTSSITGQPTVIRDSGGEPTGVIKEMDNLLPLRKQDRATLTAAIRNGLATMFQSHGVTTIGEISETVQGIEVMDELARRGDLGVRVRVYLWAPGTMPLDDACRWPGRLALRASPDLLRIQGVKLFADGGYSAKMAATGQAYLGEGEHRGAIALAESQLSAALEATRDAGLQLAVHANGDRAQEWVCGVIERAGGAPGGALRTRVEHAGNFVPHAAIPDAWQRAGIIPVPQPVFLYTFGDYFEDYLGDYGTRGRFPFAQLSADGWRLSASSDVWVGSERDATNPLFGVWCAVRRQSYAGRIIDPDQALSVEAALRMYTVDAAWTLGEEDRRGSLEAGKDADVIVLDRDPRSVAVDDIPSVRVDAVYQGGRPVYSRAGGAQRSLVQ